MATRQSNDHFSSRRSASAPTGARPAGTRFKDQPTPRSRVTQSSYTKGAQAGARTSRSHAAHASQSRTGVQAAYTRRAPQKQSKASALPVIIAVIVVVGVVAGFVTFGLPAIANLFTAGEQSTVEAGIEVQINIPEGASGDVIASTLSENHIIEDPQVYYATVREMRADASLKPGDYIFTTLQDPKEVVQQLVDGPNVDTISVTVAEGLTVDQTAAQVEQAFGISADEFLAQAKASNYAADYPFLEGAYNDSLEGYLYPKTYSFTHEPTADEVIRVMLDQFEIETADLALADGANGLSEQEIVTLASLIERETRVDDERPLVASVIYNRLDEGMPLQIDAAIVYARGGGNDAVTYDDLEIDSPYNIYQNKGLTPGPICSPSVSSISAAMSPESTDYLYYVLSAENDGTHVFSETYDEFLANRKAYQDARS